MPKPKTAIRIASQVICLGLWIFLFVKIGRQATTLLPLDLFLMTDPLANILAMSAARIWVPALLSSLVLIGLTFVLGRFFCGWICPLGTVLDFVGFLWQKNHAFSKNTDRKLRRIKYYLLIALCISAVAGSQIVFFFDPLVLSFRAISLGLLPQKAGHVAFLSLFILLIIVGLCAVTKRFWCRYLCPLGAFYGTIARFAIYRRRKKGCDACKEYPHKNCQQACVQDIAHLKQGSPQECIRCLECGTVCRGEAIEFVPQSPVSTAGENTVNLNRRSFVLSLGLGSVAGYSILRSRLHSTVPWRIVRPPMITDEEVFLDLCIRCGQCIKSCPTSTLQPLLLEAGFGGIWSPAVTPAIGGCKDNCNACSTVCPTGAIPAFGPGRQEKWTLKMGHVSFVGDLCISYKDDATKPCLKCVQVCPNKAIYVDYDAKPARPVKVDYSLCVGCGLCETECLKMVIGRPSLELYSHGIGTPTLLVADPTPLLPKEEMKKID